MKTRIFSLILALAVLLSCLAACESGESPSPITGGEENASTATDYLDFQYPEETDTLILYMEEQDNEFWNIAIGRFQELYPDVEVVTKRFEQDDFLATIRTELPAGKGPDLLFCVDTYLPDIYKSMATQTLVDLTPYIRFDEDFCEDDYNDGVMRGGKLNGRQYLVPVFYELSCVTTSEELLRESGIDPSSINTFEGLYQACVKFHDSNPDAPLFQIGAETNNLKQVYQYSGFRLIDYETNTVHFDEENFKCMVDICKLFYVKDPPQPYFMMDWAAVAKRTCMFANCGSTIFNYLNSYADLNYYVGETPILYAFPNESNGISARISRFAAVPIGAENKLNGYRMLKVLLDMEVQTGIPKGQTVQAPSVMISAMGLPVNREAIKRSIEYYAQEYMDRTGGELTDEDKNYIFGLTESVTDSVLIPTELFKLYKKSVMQYIVDKKPFENVLKVLKEKLEIYKDE
ncbi:MAG: carbohydrate ABC transporter substrate-binding protein [Clostridia bacterium]|nr:carbohydrate ABC transporter substrate-binding protein [Clostridia bacterium]